MEQTRAAIADRLIDKKVTGFRFYNLDDSYFVFDSNALWVLDTGVQIDFEDGHFSFGWNGEFDAFDYSFEQTVSELQPNERLYSVDAPAPAFEDLRGVRITDVAFDWDYYQEYDEFAQLKEEKIYVPVGIRLTFSNERELQLAAITYDIHPETKTIANARYNLEGDLLVALGETVGIDAAR